MATSKYQIPFCFFRDRKRQKKNLPVIDLLHWRRTDDRSAAMKSSEISLMELAVHFTRLNASIHTTHIKGIPYWFWTCFHLMDVSCYSFQHI